jgi:tRNA-splicing ligase RtcB
MGSLKDLLKRVGQYEYVIPAGIVAPNQKPVKVFLSETLLEILEEEALKQAVNAASLPGVAGNVVVMPDVHVGYGFPIGGVMPVDPSEGIISPGAVGFDINCGVRLISTNLDYKEIEKYSENIAKELLRNIPAGVGSTSKMKLSRRQMKEVLRLGAKWAVNMGFGLKEDLEHIEEYGQMPYADPDAVSPTAYERGADELGTVGSGNHFVEIQYVEKVYDRKIAQLLGFREGQIFIMVHSGSRGLGHQIADDYIHLALNVIPKYKLEIPDKNLACMPFHSDEGQRYWKAMCSGANYAFANRQILGWKALISLSKALGIKIDEMGYKLIYDHAHNIAKLEAHKVNGKEKILLIHRKGATRAFPKKRPEIPQSYQDIGQPVIIPGDMGRSSYLLIGESGSLEKSYGSSCHGAGRIMSRKKAKEYIKALGGLNNYLKEKKLKVVAKNKSSIMEEIPEAYKDIEEVIKVVVGENIARPILKLKPIITLKG